MLEGKLRMSMRGYRLIDFFCDGLLWGKTHMWGWKRKAELGSKTKRNGESKQKTNKKKQLREYFTREVKPDTFN